MRSKRAGDGVEAGRVDDHVEVDARSLVRMPVGRDALDRRLPEVDELDIVLVVDLVVAGLQRHAAGAEAVVLGDQLLGELPDPCTRARIFWAMKSLISRVRLRVDQHVAEVAQPDPEAGLSRRAAPRKPRAPPA